MDLPTDQIEVVIHPDSIVHSMVEFSDLSIKAQLGYPDMRLPIAYALSWPARLSLDLKPLDLSKSLSLNFHAPDEHRFPALRLAREAMLAPDTLPCILNAADEVAVAVAAVLCGCSSTPGSARSSDPASPQSSQGASGVTVFGDIDVGVTRERTR